MFGTRITARSLRLFKVLGSGLSLALLFSLMSVPSAQAAAARGVRPSAPRGPTPAPARPPAGGQGRARRAAARRPGQGRRLVRGPTGDTPWLRGAGAGRGGTRGIRRR